MCASKKTDQRKYQNAKYQNMKSFSKPFLRTEYSEFRCKLRVALYKRKTFPDITYINHKVKHDLLLRVSVLAQFT